MLDLAYISIIFVFVAYLMIAPKKELPLLIVTYALMQYLFALGIWTVDMTADLASVLLCFIVATSGLLIWGRGLNYSKDLKMTSLFISLGQWSVLLALLIFIWVESPYTYHLASEGGGSKSMEGHSTIHSLIKVCGNLLLFTTFLQIVLKWGSRWKLSNSFKDLSPLFLYFLLIVLLFVLHSPLSSYPFT